MAQPQNESALALINLTLSAVTDSREMAKEQKIDREQIEVTLRFAEIYLSALVQKLDQIDQLCASSVRDNTTPEELYHRVRDVLYAARVETAAPRGQKELDHDSEEESEEGA